MIKEVVFQCTRCGQCCISHVGPMLGKIHGLMIFIHERHLFPKEVIKPMLRYSKQYRELPGMVFVYQVDAEPCPHYIDDEKGCGIYSKRPLICRAFPFEPRSAPRSESPDRPWGEFGGVAIHESCQEIARLGAAGYKPDKIRFNENYRSSLNEIIKFWNKWLKTPLVERYDLKEKRWAFALDGVREEHLK